MVGFKIGTSAECLCISKLDSETWQIMFKKAKIRCLFSMLIDRANLYINLIPRLYLVMCMCLISEEWDIPVIFPYHFNKYVVMLAHAHNSEYQAVISTAVTPPRHILHSLCGFCTCLSLD